MLDAWSGWAVMLLIGLLAGTRSVSLVLQARGLLLEIPKGTVHDDTRNINLSSVKQKDPKARTGPGTVIGARYREGGLALSTLYKGLPPCWILLKTHISHSIVLGHVEGEKGREHVDL